MAGKRSLVAVLVLLLGFTAQAFFGPTNSKSLFRTQFGSVTKSTKSFFSNAVTTSNYYHNRYLSTSQLKAVELEDDVDIKLDSKKREKMEEFVKKMEGKRPLQRILIANNGMAATKSILSMRQWAYMTLGDERAIEFVAMATRDDLNANAEFIRLADSYIEVGSSFLTFFVPSFPLMDTPIHPKIMPTYDVTNLATLSHRSMLFPTFTDTIDTIGSLWVQQEQLRQRGPHRRHRRVTEGRNRAIFSSIAPSDTLDHTTSIHSVSSIPF